MPQETRITIKVSLDNFRRFCSFGIYGDKQDDVMNKILNLAEKQATKEREAT